MGLEDSCRDFVGRRLRVTPVPGWGWSGNPEEPAAPPAFGMRLLRLWRDENGWRGGVGEADDPDHPCNKWTVVFSTRHAGLYNFTDNVGHYNIVLTDGEIIVKRGWPLPAGNSTVWSGFCGIEIEEMGG